MANTYTPDRAEEAAISKESILSQLTLQYLQAKRCIPILWKRFVLPVIKARMEEKSAPQIYCSPQVLDIDLQAVLTNDSLRWSVIQMLRRYDYVRRNAKGDYTAGTRLWTDVDAGRMMALTNHMGEPHHGGSHSSSKTTSK